MLISHNWLQDYLDHGLAPKDVADHLTDTGLEVEGIERRDSVPGRLEGVVVGHVLTREPHPNADRLAVTTVDVGADEPLTIVCGAPNVAAGQDVPVALVGATLYPSPDEPFTIGTAKLRGVASHGMICSAAELHLGDDASGILVLEDAPAPGTPLADVFPVHSDVLFDIGLTPNRSDAMSHIGVARDLAAALNVRDGGSRTVRLPDTDLPAVHDTGRAPTIRIEDEKACPRYSGLLIEDVTIGPSPDWLRERLEAVGVRPVNNAVDITNYVLKEFGQPLHAFDADAIRGGEVVVRTLPDGTRFTTLDGEERTLSSEDLMICDAEGGMCIAGVFGGATSGVTDSTTRIFLESAYFAPRGIRRTSTRHGLRTDAAQRYEKGGDPEITVSALHRAAGLFAELCGATIASPVQDVYPTPVEPVRIDVSLAAMNTLNGTDLDLETVRAILSDLDIEIDAVEGEELTVVVPPYRTDVTRPADVAEEVLRIYGFNRVEMPATMRMSLSFRPRVDEQTLRTAWSTRLTGMGFTEVMTNSIARSARYDEEELRSVVTLENNMTAELDILRPDLEHSLLEVVAHNVNRKRDDLALFEFGTVYSADHSQRDQLVLVRTGSPGGLHHRTGRPDDVLRLTGVVESLLDPFGRCVTTEAGHPSLAFGVEHAVDGTMLARTGRLRPDLVADFDVDQPVYMAWIDWEAVQQSGSEVRYAPISKFPRVRRDLALVMDEAVAYAALDQAIRRAGADLLQDVRLFDVFRSADKLGEGVKSYAVALFWNDPTKTLTDDEVDTAMRRVLKALKKLDVDVR